MTRLVDLLLELAVPGTTDLEELDAFGDELYERVDPADLDDGIVIAQAARQSAPEFVALAEAASRANDPRAEQLLTEVAKVLPNLQRLVFMETADVALNCPRLMAAHARPLAAALADQVETNRAANGFQAYAYLEVLTRLGLLHSAARLRALDLLLSVTSRDATTFLERLPSLVGLALDRWGENELISVLGRLAEFDEAKADASFELAQVGLRAALEGGSLEAIMAGLISTRDQFLAVEAMTEARDDATIYRCALDVMVAFVGSPTGTATDSSEAMEDLTRAMSQRAIFSTRSAMGSWALPRRQAEIEWYSLAHTLRAAADPLHRSSWLTPIDTLSRVLAAYQAARSLTVISPDGLRTVLEPTVQAAFIRREGLLAHLKDALGSEALQDNDRPAAQRLLDALHTVDGSHGGGAPEKVWAAAPALAAELGTDVDAAIAVELAHAVEELPAVIGWMNREAAARARARARRSDPVVDQLLERVLSDLLNCEDLSGNVREEFVELLVEVLRFAADRADIGRASGGLDVAYLFPPTDGNNFKEVSLQRDLNSWLKSSSLRRFTRMEEPDVGAGRADVTVTQDHRFTIEVKRELTNASRSALFAAYGGQAAAYSVVGPRLSIAAILDLTDHTKGIPSLKESVWVDEVPIAGGKPRHVVTVVIRGNRPTPRQTKTN